MDGGPPKDIPNFDQKGLNPVFKAIKTPLGAHEPIVAPDLGTSFFVTSTPSEVNILQNIDPKNAARFDAKLIENKHIHGGALVIAAHTKGLSPELRASERLLAAAIDHFEYLDPKSGKKALVTELYIDWTPTNAGEIPGDFNEFDELQRTLTEYERGLDIKEESNPDYRRLAGRTATVQLLSKPPFGYTLADVRAMQQPDGSLDRYVAVFRNEDKDRLHGDGAPLATSKR